MYFYINILNIVHKTQNTPERVNTFNIELHGIKEKYIFIEYTQHEDG